MEEVSENNSESHSTQEPNPESDLLKKNVANTEFG